MVVDCICEYGKNIPEEQKICRFCGADLTPLHNLKVLPRFFYEDGIKLASQRQWSAAMDRLKTAIFLDPHISEAYLALGNVYLFNGYCDNAIAEYEKALKFDPDNENIKEAKIRAERLKIGKEPEQNLKEPPTKLPEKKTLTSFLQNRPKRNQKKNSNLKE